MSAKKYCLQCGNELNENAKFCNRCGAPVPQDGGSGPAGNTGQLQSNEQPQPAGQPQASGQQQFDEQPQPSRHQGEKKGNLWMILFLIAAVVAVVALIGFFIVRSNYRTLLDAQDEVVETVVEEDLVMDEPEAEEETVDEPGVTVWGGEAGETDADADTEEVTVEEETMEETDAGAAVVQMDKSDVKQGALDLYDRLMEYSTSDPEKFADLVVGASDEDIQTLRESFSRIYGEHYDRELAVVAVERDPYYYVGICSYTVAGTYPDFSLHYENSTLVISSYGGEWKLDVSQEGNDVINEDESLAQLYPADFYESGMAGRNAAAFGPFYLWQDETAVFEGCFDQELLLMWQNEDGSVDTAVWFGNGTDGAISVSSLSLTVTDSVLGTVLDSSGSISEMINTGYGKVVTYHFDASEVLTGTQSWGSMSSQIQVNTKG